MERVDGRKLRFQHRRGEVLAAATEHALEKGLDDLSLRKVAESVGVSHATLVHHFASKDRLVAEIVDRVLAETLSLPDMPRDDPDPLRAIWRRAVSESGRRYVRLFVAITGHAMYGDPALTKAVADSMRQRNDLIAAGLVRYGCPESRAQAVATSLMSTLRGLFVDLLATGDEQRVSAAFDDFAADVQRRVLDGFS
ncbi:TetR/AcrR family transcriptional regulator [Saccharopolyspora endophytica]|uniref:TetR/AcrR family transcriptional regulator n=1 Tax=Saccharopolyspora endophytica TaxID=543886 RepID=A0ABS5DE46_9PSEU|nr:TetR/AcrR family transcriptional regulator [Saccharopolyspora endophytica]MBQ0924554.1 TetR/AcrR family transcriptional regulator [Saccharopolyspora endophytica]